MKTTIELADDLLRAAKEQARKDHTTLRALTEEGLRLVLGARRKRKGKHRFRMATFKGDGLQPGIDLRNRAQMLDLIYRRRGL